MSEGGSGPNKTVRLLAVCGVIAPIAWVVGATVAGLFHPGYNHVAQQLSELGAVGAPYAAVWNAAVASFGLLMVGFAFGLHRGISGSRGSMVGPALVAVSGFAWASQGLFFSCDPGCIPVSFTGVMHGTVGLVGLSGLFFANIVLWRTLKKDSRWQQYSSYSLLTAVVTFALFLGVNLSFSTLAALGIVGLVQRVLLGIPILWIEVMAIRLLRLSISKATLESVGERESKLQR